jgi:hypothetical protein
MHERGTIDDPGGIQPVMAQGGDEGLGLPVAKGCMVDEARAFGRPPGGFGHIRLERGLVDKTYVRQQVTHERLTSCNPDMARLPDLRPLLFGGLEVFFLCQAETVQGTPDRNAVDCDAMTIRHLQHQIIQG